MRSGRSPVHGPGADDLGRPRRVVVGVDRSEASCAALRWALEAAATRRSVLEVLHCWEPPVLYGPAVGTLPYDVEEIEAEAERLVRELIARVTAGRPDLSEVPIEQSVECGGPATHIVDAGREASLIVVGRRGLGRVGRLLSGSVSDRVAHRADTAVVVVPAASPG
jgi:nucleotide-binding universal stress UspA family protein